MSFSRSSSTLATAGMPSRSTSMSLMAIDLNRKRSTTSLRPGGSYQSLTENAFRSAYAAACAKYKTRPMPCVRIKSKANSVEIFGDRMKADDWMAAIEAISTEVDTHHMCIKNKQRIERLSRGYDTFISVMEAPKNVLPFGTPFVVQQIACSVQQMLCNSDALVFLELKNLLFDEQALEMLWAGVRASRSLQHLSLANCRVGDIACAALFRVLADKPNVRSVDLTGCSLRLAPGLVDAIKRQQYKRNEECWAHSLRYRTANPDVMHGLRRLTLNDNPELGDGGAVADLFEALKDDLFVNAVDLQRCGLTDRGAELALSMLMVNTALAVLDIRNNELVSPEALKAVMIRLSKNNAGRRDTELWKWTRLGRGEPAASGSSSSSLSSFRRKF